MRALSLTLAQRAVYEHTLTRTHVQASNQRRLLSRGETRSATPKEMAAAAPRRRKTSLPVSDHIRLRVATRLIRARWHDTSVCLDSSSFDGVFFSLPPIEATSKSSEKFRTRFWSHFYPTLALPARPDSYRNDFLLLSPSSCRHFPDPRRTFRGQKVQ